MQEVSGVKPCAGAQRSPPFVALQTHLCFFFSFCNSINIHQFLALQNHHWAVPKSHRYGKFMQKSVVLPMQELPALCENSAESFHLGQDKKKKVLALKSETSFPFLPFEKDFAPDG